VKVPPLHLPFTYLKTYLRFRETMNMNTRHAWTSPPNGLPFSCGKRATTSLQKANDLAREAVGCNGVFGRLLPL
jgi:hypothetical protein